MTTPAPVQIRAQELLMKAANAVEVYGRIARESEKGEADDALIVIREVLIDLVDEFVCKFFTLKAVTSVVPLSDVDMSDLRDFILFVMTDAQALLDDDHVISIRERFKEITKHQKTVIDRKKCEELAAELRNHDKW